LDFSSEIIIYYNKHHRKLPWRVTKDPYVIWISEVILQQTRVDQGLPYFYKFIAKYPDVESLAGAAEDEVFKLWQGLGYYSRAANMLKTAKEVKEKFDGKFPENHAELLKLKGIGEYTAAAIASFAYNLPFPVVDGNVFRVLSRYFGIDKPVPESRKIFAEVALGLMASHDPALFNQAIMEFGAMVCVPKNPFCQDCSLKAGCFAFNQKKIDAFPVKKPAKAKKHRYFYYLCLSDSKEQIYLRKRSGKDIWKNLYEFPLLEYSCETPPAKVLEDMSNKLGIFSELNIISSQSKTHVLSHQIINAVVLFAVIKEELSCQDYLKIKHLDIEKYAVPALLEPFVKYKLRNL
jgi:A/G-specific adenine glycosylase